MGKHDEHIDQSSLILMFIHREIEQGDCKGKLAIWSTLSDQIRKCFVFF